MTVGVKCTQVDMQTHSRLISSHFTSYGSWNAVVYVEKVGW